MKKILVALILALSLFVVSGLPVLAEPSGLEEWSIVTYEGGLCSVTLTIDTVTLETDHFDIYNGSSTNSVYLYVKRGKAVVWELTVPPSTDQEVKYTLRFSRLPKTEPVDLNSVRYPAGYSFGTRYPAN